MKKLLFIFISIAYSKLLFSTTWLVGPAQNYTAPSQVSTLVSDGDTINIEAATYTSDVCKWTASHILIRGIGGRPVLNANNTAYGQKGIFVIDGNNCIIENIEFSHCHDAIGNDQNWAGIRLEGSGITVRNCYFHDNDNGILDNGVSTSAIIIEYSEFEHNGYGDGYSHNLYIGHSDTLIFRFNYSHRASIGHELKSRAKVNYILYNRITNESDGDASRNIDLPNGGYALIIGNSIEQGPNATNSGIMEFGLEGLNNPSPHNCYLINNTVINDKASGLFFDIQTGADLLKAYNNVFAGGGNIINGIPAQLDTLSNLIASLSSCHFVDPLMYNYHLTNLSPGVNNGANPGFANNGYNLNPTFEYTHPVQSTNRFYDSSIDIGAYEYNATAGISSFNKQNFKIFPNPSSHSVIITLSNPITTSSISIYSTEGKLIKQICDIRETIVNINDNELKAGIYNLIITDNHGSNTTQKLIITD